MKKLIYLPLLLIALSLGIKKVNAIEAAYYFSNFYDHYADIVADSETYSENIEYLINYYNTNYSSDYSDYYIYFSYLNDTLSSISLYATNTLALFSYDNNSGLYTSDPGTPTPKPSITFTINSSDYSPGEWYQNDFSYILYSASSDIVFNDHTNCSAALSNLCHDGLQLPSWSDLTLDVSYPLLNIYKGDTIPTYMSLTNGTPSADFTRVDMSDYDYIVLSLRNYDTTTFNTTIYSLGRLCFTPVYNYGMTQKSELITGYQNQACTEYYNNLTPVMITIIQADLDNHAVYYIKRYGNETNILEIPTSIFDITYITDSNANDPQVVIGGRSYPITKYDDLTDTANISSEEGYVSGQVCALGDVNCYYSAKDMDFNDVFTQPLKTLKSLWSSISLIFNIVSEFISLLPPVLQSFLFTAFMICVVIGILKLVLGAV